MKNQVFGTATLSPRGRITIPKDTRDALFITEGAKIDFRLQGGAVVIAEARNSVDPLDAWFGRFPLGSGSTDPVTLTRQLRGGADLTAIIGRSAETRAAAAHGCS